MRLTTNCLLVIFALALLLDLFTLRTNAFLQSLTKSNLKNSLRAAPSTTITVDSLYRPLKVSIIGSGSWGTAVARRIGRNIQTLRGNGDYTFENELLMWVHEEVDHDLMLSDLLNTKHENTKFLPGIQLPTNLRACPQILKSCKDADVLLFIAPHQYLTSVLEQIKGQVRHGAIAVSLIKGLDVGVNGPILLSDVIRDTLGLSTDVAVLMGANLATEVARDSPVEATIACKDLAIAHLVARLFQCSVFRVDVCSDVLTVEVCGALKNVVAMGAGFCDAVETFGASSKAAVLRRGIYEMVEVCRAFGKEEFDANAVINCSSIIADVIASSYGGRNYRCAREFAKRVLAMEADPDHSNSDSCAQRKKRQELWIEIERDLLKGQKLQGLGTCDELMACLQNARLLDKMTVIGGEKATPTFGLFQKIHAISRLGDSPRTIMEY